MIIITLVTQIGRKRTCLMAAFSSMAAWVLLSTSHTGNGLQPQSHDNDNQEIVYYKNKLQLFKGWLLLLARALTGLADCTAGPPGEYDNIMFMIIHRIWNIGEDNHDDDGDNFVLTSQGCSSYARWRQQISGSKLLST